MVKYKKEDLSQVNNQLYEWLATINDKSSDSSVHHNEQIVKQNAKIFWKIVFPATIC